MKRHDVLIISNTPLDSPYGASSSLRTHLNQLSESNISYILVSPPCLNSSRPKSNQFYFSSLPWIYNYDGSPLCGFNIRAFISSLLKVFGFLAFMIRLRMRYRFSSVHINSFSILPIVIALKITYPFASCVLVLREFIQRRNLWTLYFLRLIDTLVFIDNSVRSRLYSLYPCIYDKKSYLIPNFITHYPVTIDCLNFLDSLSIANRYIFSFVGRLDDPSKGFDFVFDSFIDFAKKNSTCVLLVFSACNVSLKSNYLLALDRENLSNRVFFLGEVPTLLEKGYYNQINCVIRGESSYRPGRTVYEALLHNCCVIIPGLPAEISNDPSLNSFSRSLVSYSPRNKLSIARAYKNALLFNLNGAGNTSLTSSFSERKQVSSYIQSFMKAYRLA